MKRVLSALVAIVALAGVSLTTTACGSGKSNVKLNVQKVDKS